MYFSEPTASCQGSQEENAKAQGRKEEKRKNGIFFAPLR
jgi:hypothetical protein